jgi:hypothetical protein
LSFTIAIKAGSLMNSDFKDLLSTFNAHKVQYLIVGAYAFMKHAEPRYTKDLDVWIRPSMANAHRVFKALHQFGAPLSKLTEDDFARPGFYYQIGVEPVRIDILMSIPGLTFSQAWKNRVISDLGGVSANILSKEDLIASKNASGRPQDLVDIQTLNTPMRKAKRPGKKKPIRN